MSQASAEIDRENDRKIGPPVAAQQKRRSRHAACVDAASVRDAAVQRRTRTCAAHASCVSQALEGRVIANQYKIVLSHHLYRMMKHFYPDGSGLFHDDNATIHRARGVTEWFDGYENDVNHML